MTPLDDNARNGAETVLDDEIISELLEGLDVEDVLEVVELSFREIDQLVIDSHDAVNTGDLTSIKAIGHKIKGCASGIGAAKLARVASDLEAAGAVDEAVAGFVSELKDLAPQSQRAIMARLEP